MCCPLVLLACRSLIHLSHPSCPAAPLLVSYLCPLSAYSSRRSPRSSHPFILPALATPARLTLLALPVPRVVGRGVPRLALISSCVPSAVSAFRLSSSRRAYRYTECCGDGDRRMWGIRASAPISCTSFLGRRAYLFFKHGAPSFFYFFRFLSSCPPVPHVDNRGDVG